MTLKSKPTDAELKDILAEHGKWLSNQNLGKRANFNDTDLVGVDLAGANLYCARFYNANLTNANLYDADLKSAYFHSAYLAGAHLAGADLTCANFIDANFTGANLSSASLYGAQLTNANFTGANLNGANLTGSAGGDFTQTHGIYYIGGLQYKRGALINPTNTPFYTPAVQKNPAIQSIPTVKAVNICQCPIRDLMTSGHNSNCVERK